MKVLFISIAPPVSDSSAGHWTLLTVIRAHLTSAKQLRPESDGPRRVRPEEEEEVEPQNEEVRQEGRPVVPGHLKDICCHGYHRHLV